MLSFFLKLLRADPEIGPGTFHRNEFIELKDGSITEAKLSLTIVDQFYFGDIQLSQKYNKANILFSGEIKYSMLTGVGSYLINNVEISDLNAVMNVYKGSKSPLINILLAKHTSKNTQPYIFKMERLFLNKNINCYSKVTTESIRCLATF